MSTEKLAKLVEKLIQKTDEGKIKWESTETDDEFQLSFAEYTIRLSFRQSPSNNQAHAYFIEIYNSNGQLIESVNDEELIDYIKDSFKEMGGLFSQARRITLGVDKAIEDILKELDEEDLPF